MLNCIHILASSTGRKRLGALAVAVAIAVAGTVAGWRLAGPTESETDLGRVSFEVAPHLFGDVDVFVPIADWGLRAESFDSLFELEVELRAVDRRGALTAASGDASLLQGLEQDLEDGARSAVLRAALWGLGATLGIALFFWMTGHPSGLMRPASCLSAGLALLGTMGSIGWAAVSFDSRAFADPSYYGRGEELAQLLDFFERQRDNDRYTATFENALTNFSAYLSGAPRTGEAGGRTLLTGSDIHNNALVLPALARFAEDQPVLLAGDFGHEGNEAEARLIAPRIAALGAQVIAVSGNHDSEGLMRALAREGVTVLEKEGRLKRDGTLAGSPLVRAQGLTIAGFPDPLEWRGGDPSAPERVFSFPELEEGDLREQEARAELLSWFRDLPKEPDVVLVHQNTLAQHLASELTDTGYGRPLTIVTGHDHYQHVERYGEIAVVDAGTLGAGGALRVGQEFAGLGRLHFQGPEPTLESVDLIRIEPLSGQAQADRMVLDVACPLAEAAVEPCRYEPQGL